MKNELPAVRCYGDIARTKIQRECVVYTYIYEDRQYHVHSQTTTFTQTH